MIRIRNCIHCGKVFETEDVIQMFCSEECESAEVSYFEPKKELVCAVCGNLFYPKTANQKYCSQECNKEQSLINNKIRWHNTHRKKKKRSNAQSIADLTVEARKHGMTYGKYVAMLELEKMCSEKNKNRN